MRLRTRFFMAFAGFSIVLLLSLAALGQWAFERGLDQYLGQRQQQTLTRLAEDFAGYYQRQGSFQGVRLRALIRFQEDDGREPLPPGLILRDASGTVLFGPDIPSLGDTAIVVDGNVVGHLALPARPPMHDRFSERFQQRQWRMVVMGMVPGLLLALLASWLLARHLVRPLETSTRFAGQLAGGKLDARLALERRDEIGSLADSLNALATSLQQAASARERWLADISHELRTPVAILRGELEALEDGIRQPTRERLGALGEEVSHLSRLLDDLHDLALADAGALRYTFAPTDMGQLLAGLVESAAPRFEDAGLALQCERPAAGPVLFADGTRLRQLCDNLLQNALRYTDRGGLCRVTLSSRHTQVTLVVEDSGPGLDQEALARLFDPFWRHPQASDRARHGAGLGLAICQRIVHAHGGQIDAQPSPLGGVRITVELPGRSAS
ncbi:MAG: ATP-binding protein [Alcanivoracaceae bacterium]|nr:ATP-binding protein [Alcanivoracaceae bacterium]